MCRARHQGEIPHEVGDGQQPERARQDHTEAEHVRAAERGEKIDRDNRPGKRPGQHHEQIERLAVAKPTIRQQPSDGGSEYKVRDRGQAGHLKAAKKRSDRA